MDLENLDFKAPVTFDTESRTFQGVHHTYKILDSLPVCRYKELGVIEPQIAYGCDLKTLMGFAKSVYTHVNEGNNAGRADDAVNAYKLMESLKDVKERINPIFKLIDLYTIRPGDELTDFGDRVLKEKINDWALIDTNFFLAISIRLIPNYLSAYKQLSQTILKETPTNQEEI